jgi:CRISPR-associated protein Cmr1
MPCAGGTDEENKARRASPLFFHVHPVAGKYKGLVLSLPAVFHHKDSLSKVDNGLLSGFIKQLQEVSLWT